MPSITVRSALGQMKRDVLNALYFTIWHCGFGRGYQKDVAVIAAAPFFADAAAIIIESSSSLSYGLLIVPVF